MNNDKIHELKIQKNSIHIYKGVEIISKPKNWIVIEIETVPEEWFTNPPENILIKIDKTKK